ncbi:hypothetical protein CAC42_120 [Sphaceloma murrayae]|uniref:HTH APSES-type domain-containing protein n=1 Tax=Sphaceloma murrayae TaxID=2082308 RepID=A0A2K1QMM0_9PEZI|nr:hypothetical protein CAC42_120 [Sphaceloma murrayae]
MPPREEGKVFSATYSNVPVYECFSGVNSVMRRRSDDWINATHILKVADFDKPTRTRILEREVQKGVHEKIQGGFGRFQGTWIPLHDGRALAEKHGVLDKLIAILDYVPGDKSPPPAPKHTVAAPSKPRANRQPVAPRRVQGKVTQPANNRMRQHDLAALNQIAEEYDPRFQQEDTPDNVTLTSDMYPEDYGDSAQYTNPRKRKRFEDMLSPQDEQHQLWAEELLDYFMLLESPSDPHHRPPLPPDGINLDRPIDDKGHTALHWAAAMGDTSVVRTLIERGASIDSVSKSGETPLMRAVIFTNSYDKQSMERLAGWLIRTVAYTEWFGSTVFHHIASTTSSKSKYACARYYLDAILNRMSEVFSLPEVERILNIQDRNGDTAITIAARNGARKCVRALIGRNAAVDFPNNEGETADELIVQLNHRRRDGRHRQLSSSPFQLDPNISGAASNPHLHSNGHTTAGAPRVGLPPSHPHSFLNSSPVIPQGPEAHSSEAATVLTTQIFPLLQSKSAKLAAAYDAEIGEKDTEVLELERVVGVRGEEIEGLKRGIREMVMRDKEDNFDTQLRERLEGLISECEARVEGEQADLLKGFVEQAQGPEDVNGSGDEAREKEEMMRRIFGLQEERRGLVREVVRNQSLAGLGERQADYRRLITGALGVKDADVEGMLPEICQELEEASELGGGLGVGGGNAVVAV